MLFYGPNCFWRGEQYIAYSSICILHFCTDDAAGDFDEWDCDSDENEDDADIMYYEISLIFTLRFALCSFCSFIAFKSGHVLTSLGTSDFSK